MPVKMENAMHEPKKNMTPSCLWHISVASVSPGYHDVGEVSTSTAGISQL